MGHQVVLFSIFSSACPISSTITARAWRRQQRIAERRSRKAPVTPRPYAHTRKPPAKPTETVTGRRAQAIRGGKSRQSASTGNASLL